MKRRDLLSCLYELNEQVSAFESALFSDDENSAYEALDKISHCSNAYLTEMDEQKKRTIPGRVAR